MARLSQMDLLGSRKRAYQNLFLGDDDQLNESAKIVLKDLIDFCRVVETKAQVGAGGIDTNASMIALGREEVFIHINEQLFLKQSYLYQLADMEA